MAFDEEGEGGVVAAQPKEAGDINRVCCPPGSFATLDFVPMAVALEGKDYTPLQASDIL